MRYKLSNGTIDVEIDSHGAEVKSVKKNGTEYMWCGDMKYWGRTSPVLFPFVGSLKDGKYKTDGKEYTMTSHGFARDMEFSLVSKNGNSAVFELKSSEETLAKYPFEFVLRISYTIQNSSLSIMWEVENPADKEMYFSIGAHPAFMCPVNGGKQSDYKLKFNSKGDIKYYLLEGAYVDKSRVYTLPLHDGYADITENMFDADALIVENGQADKISLCRPNGTEYVRVTTDAPLFGVWSPAKKNAPFICIEPWYGRCDSVDFDGDLSEREYTNTLEPGKTFNAEYSIEFM